MKQGTLWELEPGTDAVANPIWERLDASVRTDVMTKLAALMVKAVRPNPDPLPSEKEADHE